MVREHHRRRCCVVAASVAHHSIARTPQKSEYTGRGFEGGLTVWSLIVGHSDWVAVRFKTRLSFPWCHFAHLRRICQMPCRR